MDVPGATAAQAVEINALVRVLLTPNSYEEAAGGNGGDGDGEEYVQATAVAPPTVAASIAAPTAPTTAPTTSPSAIVPRVQVFSVAVQTLTVTPEPCSECVQRAAQAARQEFEL